MTIFNNNVSLPSPTIPTGIVTPKVQKEKFQKLTVDTTVKPNDPKTTYVLVRSFIERSNPFSNFRSDLTSYEQEDALETGPTSCELEDRLEECINTEKEAYLENKKALHAYRESREPGIIRRTRENGTEYTTTIAEVTQLNANQARLLIDTINRMLGDW
jgi:hypothetical protein